MALVATVQKWLKLIRSLERVACSLSVPKYSAKLSKITITLACKEILSRPLPDLTIKRRVLELLKVLKCQTLHPNSKNRKFKKGKIFRWATASFSAAAGQTNLREPPEPSSLKAQIDITITVRLNKRSPNGNRADNPIFSSVRRVTRRRRRCRWWRESSWRISHDCSS